MKQLCPLRGVVLAILAMAMQTAVVCAAPPARGAAKAPAPTAAKTPAPAAAAKQAQAPVAAPPAYGDRVPANVAALVNAAEAAFAQGDYATARARFEQALARCEPEHAKPATAARIRANLSATSAVMADYAAARRYGEQALANYRKLNGEKSPETIRALSDLAFVLSRMGDLSSAQTYFERALAIAKEVSGDRHPSTIPLRSGLAGVLASMGDSAAARAYFEQALSIQQESLGENNPETARLRYEFGSFLSGTGKYKPARDNLQRALAIQRKVLPEHDLSTGNTLEAMGTVCTVMNDYPAARKYIDEALQMRRAMLPPDHPLLVKGLSNLGFVLGCEGDNAAALDCFQQALAIQKKSLGDENPETATTYNYLATFYAASNDWLSAARDEDLSRRVVRRYVATALGGLTERDQLLFLSNEDQSRFYSALSLALSGRQEKTLAALSAGWVLNGKALTQEVLAERGIRARESRDPKLSGITQQLSEVRAQQAQLTLGKTSARESEELVRLTAAERDLSRQLAKAGSKSLQTESWVELDQVRAKLGPREVLIDFARFPLFNLDFAGSPKRWLREHYAAWIVPAAGQGDVKLVDLGEADAIDKAVISLRKAINAVYTVDRTTGRTKPTDPRSIRQFDAAATQLSQLILHPLLSELGPATQLVLSPDYALWLVPWSALYLPDGHYAVEAFEISYVVSGRELINTSPAVKKRSPLIVANPNFDLPPAEAKKIAQSVLTRTKAPAESTAKNTRLKPPAPPLARALDDFGNQVKFVAPKLEAYTGKKPGILQGNQALETLVKAVHGPQVIWLATHGFIEGVRRATRTERPTGDADPVLAGAPDNPLLHCGVMLAGCNWRNAEQGEDGILTGMEILGIDLRGTELVVLSACDTGNGEVRPGEGVAGVRQAFQLAGAEAVVSTLWPVFVNEATDQMNDFFTFLAAGQGKAEALRSAQLAALRRLREQNRWSSPMVWAPFTLTGRGR